RLLLLLGVPGFVEVALVRLAREVRAGDRPPQAARRFRAGLPRHDPPLRSRGGTRPDAPAQRRPPDRPARHPLAGRLGPGAGRDPAGLALLTLPARQSSVE